jgi:hypothetical protein
MRRPIGWLLRVALVVGLCGTSRAACELSTSSTFLRSYNWERYHCSDMACKNDLIGAITADFSRDVNVFSTSTLPRRRL